MIHRRLAMIPGAGFGTRMGEYTKSVPKPLLPVNGVPLLFYSLFLLHLWKVELCVINLHYLGGQIRHALQDFPWFKIEFSEEQDRILGTSGGIRQAMAVTSLDGWFLLLNPDTIFWPGLDPFLEASTMLEQRRLPDPGILLYLNPKSPQNSETGFGPEHPFAGSPPGSKLSMGRGDWFYSGMSILHTDLLSRLQPGIPHELRDIFAGESSRRLFGRPFPPEGIRLDCGTEKEYTALKKVDTVPPELKQQWEAFLKPLAPF